ncbi:hypothetical protein [Shewanella sp.]
MEDLMKKKNGKNRQLTDRDITTLAKELSQLMPPVTLEIEMTCPGATA